MVSQVEAGQQGLRVNFRLSLAMTGIMVGHSLLHCFKQLFYIINLNFIRGKVNEYYLINEIAFYEVYYRIF